MIAKLVIEIGLGIRADHPEIAAPHRSFRLFVVMHTAPWLGGTGVGVQHLADGGDETFPALGALAEDLSAGGGHAVVLGAAIVLAHAPFGGHPAAMLHPM